MWWASDMLGRQSIKKWFSEAVSHKRTKLNNISDELCDYPCSRPSPCSPIYSSIHQEIADSISSPSISASTSRSPLQVPPVHLTTISPTIMAPHSIPQVGPRNRQNYLQEYSRSSCVAPMIFHCFKIPRLPPCPSSSVRNVFLLACPAPVRHFTSCCPRRCHFVCDWR